MYSCELLIDEPIPSIDPGEIIYIKKDIYNQLSGQLETTKEKWVIESVAPIVTDRMFAVTIISDVGRKSNITVIRQK